jgi:hypothetical protein
MNGGQQEYLLLIIGGCLGVYQIAAAAGGFKGLCFFRNYIFTYVSGFLILGGAMGWFFTTGDLKMNADPDYRMIEGTQQLQFFLLGAFLALMITFLISSLAGSRRFKPGTEATTGKGLEDLKGMTVFQALAHRLKNRGEHN